MPGWVLAGTLVLCASCTGASPAPDPTTSSVATRPRNLLLITIDTLRADRVGSYGHAAATTEAIDDLARSGTRFTRAFAPAPITLPSHATLLTGRNPPAHHARHNGLPMRNDVPTLATALTAHGFSTGAFVSAFPLDRRFGLARGFGTYDDGLPRGRDGRRASERAGALTVDAATEWLDAHRTSPFFLWVHLFEPHAPYGERDGRDAARPVLARYDAEIGEADRQVGRLVSALGSDRASTLVVVTADHGEAFGEHGEIGHSVFIYDTTLRVPLVLSGPGVPAGRSIGADVGLVDIAPTVLGLLGQTAIPSDGVDLARLMEGGRLEERALYAESFAPLLDFGWSPLRSIRAGPWKYIAAPRAELFDLSQDPDEAHDRVSERQADASRLSALVEALASDSLTRSNSPDPEAARRLGSLGYVALPGRHGGGPRPDPKDRRAIAARLAEVTSGEIAPERLVPTLETLLQEDPGNLHVTLRLGVALADRGSCDLAERHLRVAMGSGVPTADPFVSLAYCHRQRGATAAAARALEAADRIEPGDPVVTANLGLLAFDAGRMDEAITRLLTALARDPDLHEARFFLARAYARSGQRTPAEEQARELLARLPASAPQRAEVERLLAALR